MKLLQAGYGSRADTVINQFRSSKTSVLKKRLLYAVFNPQYVQSDYKVEGLQRHEDIEL